MTVVLISTAFRRDVRLSWLAALMPLLLAATGAQCQTLPPIWQKWISSLKSSGYGVTQGTAYEFTTATCQQTLYPTFHSCFSNDPEDPYIVVQPPVGNGYVDPYFGAAAATVDAAGTLVGQAYRLNTSQALLVIVTLPPKAAYLSYQSYLFTRPAKDYSDGVEQLSVDPHRAQIFGTFNNSIDSVTIAAQSGLSFDGGTVAFITTPNAALSSGLAKNFAAVGGNPSLLFTEAMDSTLHPGLSKMSDDFTTLLRYSIPKNTAAGTAWREGAPQDVAVYRIVQPPGMGVSRFRRTPLRDKHYNTDESGHAATLSELSGLLRGWMATYENDDSVAVHMADTSERVRKDGQMVSGELGPYCIEHGTNCASDSQDSDTYKRRTIGKLRSGHMFMIAGVNHAVTTNSTFFSVASSDDSIGVGINSAAQTTQSAAGFNAGTLNGSAGEVLSALGLFKQASPALQADLPNLYVQIFTRPCNPAEAFCALSTTLTLNHNKLPASHTVSVTERAYVLPGYPNGANPDYLLDPQVIY